MKYCEKCETQKIAEMDECPHCGSELRQLSPGEVAPPPEPVEVPQTLAEDEVPLRDGKPLKTITHGGRTLTVRQWAAVTGLSLPTIYARLGAGLSPVDVFRPPIRARRRAAAPATDPGPPARAEPPRPPAETPREVGAPPADRLFVLKTSTVEEAKPAPSAPESVSEAAPPEAPEALDLLDEIDEIDAQIEALYTERVVLVSRLRKLWGRSAA